MAVDEGGEKKERVLVQAEMDVKVRKYRKTWHATGGSGPKGDKFIHAESAEFAQGEGGIIIIIITLILFA